ncbi:MAG: 4-hydroxybenzoate octaprenyltransferase [Pseudomonadota bacterium]
MTDNIQTRQTQGRVADAPSGHWVYRLLPPGAWPYAQIARWDRPIGWQLLLWPCLWSLGIAAAAAPADALGGRFVWFAVLFLVGAIAMRGAGCTYNDIVDTDIDGQVARTASRPLPSGRITKRNAAVFLVLQALTGFFVLIQFNWYAIIVGLCSLLFVAIYPFMKRVTYWPQLFLGLAFSWGAFMGWAAVFGALDWPPLLLYAACIAWTIGYDTIYAHQDKEDDAIVGVKSTARLFGQKTKGALVALYGLMLALMAAAFATAGAQLFAWIGLALAAAHMANQIRVLDIDDANQCLALFRSNGQVGAIIAAGLMLSAFSQVL